MKKHLFVVLFACLISSVFAQTGPASLQWERSQNGVASTSNTFVKTKSDAAGNIYALTYSDEDMLVVKFNSATQVSQTYRYNNPSNGNDYPKDFDVDASGNVYISGYSYMLPTYYATVVKFDASGNLLWDLHYLPSGNWIYPSSVTANALCLDNSGNVYFTGSVNDSLFAAKVNTSGTVLWSTKVNVAGNHYGEGNDIAIDAFNSVYVAGKYKNALGDYDAITFKTNASGVLLWTKQIAGFAGVNDEAINIGVDNSSNAYVSSDIADSSSSNYTSYITKYNASGAQQWQKKLHQPGQYNSSAIKLQVDNVGNSYVGLHTMSTSILGFTKIYKHTSSGTESYATVIDDVSDNDNALTDLCVDQNANLYATGNYPSTGRLFYSKLNSTGTLQYSVSFDHNGASNFYGKAGIVAEQSGFFNIVSTSTQVYNCRFNNLASFLYEGIYAGNANTGDQAIKVFAQGNTSVYALGTVSNDNTFVDAVLSKYDSEGNILWQNIIDNNMSQDYAYDMAKDSVFNIYISKSVNGTSEIVKYDSIGSPIWSYPSNVHYKKIIVADGGHAFLAGDYEGYVNAYEGFHIAKVSPSGSLVYSNTISGSPGYQLTLGSMNIDNNYRIIAAGHRIYNLGQPDQEIALVVEKFSTTGNLLWHREIPLTDSTSSSAVYGCWVSKVLVDDNNDIYVLGTASTAANFGHSMSVVAKYSGSGNLLWNNSYDGNGAWHETSGDMKFLSGGQIIMYAASTSSQVLRRLGTNTGNVIWETPVYLGYSDNAASLTIDGNDDIYFAGNSVVGNSLRDLVLGKMTANGDLKWVTTKAGASVGNDWPVMVDVTSAGRIYLAASMSNNSGTPTDFSLLKFCDIAQPSLSTTGQTQDICPGSQVTMVAPAGSLYLWSDGTTTNDSLIVSATGNYFCTVYKTDGCYKNSDTVSVQIKTPPSTPQICAVTVDSLSTHNIIFWDKSGVTGAVAFNVYREDQTNVYSYIGTVVYDSLSEYHDYGANPNVTTKRYKITAIDTCGQESPMSNYHNTIYIVSNGSGQFSWNPIYTIENSANPVDNYLLMRDDNSSGNWQQVASTAGTQFIVNDPNYALYPNGSWRVETAWNISCLATRGAINTSRSNIRSPTSVGMEEQGNSTAFSFVPNPANEEIRISVGGGKESLIQVYNTLGQEVIKTTTNLQQTTLDIAALQAGTYFIKISNEKGSSIKKLVKN